MRLLIGFLLLLVILVYFQSEQNDCYLGGMSSEQWLDCIVR